MKRSLCTVNAGVVAVDRFAVACTQIAIPSKGFLELRKAASSIASKASSSPIPNVVGRGQGRQVRGAR
jgi:hypothetical protein